MVFDSCKVSGWASSNSPMINTFVHSYFLKKSLITVRGSSICIPYQKEVAWDSRLKLGIGKFGEHYSQTASQKCLLWLNWLKDARVLERRGPCTGTALDLEPWRGCWPSATRRGSSHWPPAGTPARPTSTSTPSSRRSSAAAVSGQHETGTLKQLSSYKIYDCAILFVCEWKTVVSHAFLCVHFQVWSNY